MTLSPKRTGRITGSNVGAILGLNPYRTAEDVLRDMVRAYHGAEREFTGNVATEYGSYNEAGALFDFTLRTGISVKASDQFFIHPEYDWLGATPDGITEDGKLIEVKCPYGKRNGGEFKLLNEQQHYHAQMQIEMACAVIHCCYFYQWSSLSDHLDLVYLDDKWFAEALPVLKAFHQRYLSELTNPDHLKPRLKIIETIESKMLLVEYKELQDAIDQANERKKEVLKEIVIIAGGVDAEICGHKLTSVEREGSVSYAKALKEYAPDADLEPFRGKPTSYWKLS